MWFWGLVAGALVWLQHRSYYCLVHFERECLNSFSSLQWCQKQPYSVFPRLRRTFSQNHVIWRLTLGISARVLMDTRYSCDLSSLTCCDLLLYFLQAYLLRGIRSRRMMPGQCENPYSWRSQYILLIRWSRVRLPFYRTSYITNTISGSDWTRYAYGVFCKHCFRNISVCSYARDTGACSSNQYDCSW